MSCLESEGLQCGCFALAGTQRLPPPIQFLIGSVPDGS